VITTEINYFAIIMCCNYYLCR